MPPACTSRLSVWRQGLRHAPACSINRIQPPLVCVCRTLCQKIEACVYVAVSLSSRSSALRQALDTPPACVSASSVRTALGRRSLRSRRWESRHSRPSSCTRRARLASCGTQVCDQCKRPRALHRCVEVCRFCGLGGLKSISTGGVPSCCVALGQICMTC